MKKLLLSLLFLTFAVIAVDAPPDAVGPNKPEVYSFRLRVIRVLEKSEGPDIDQVVGTCFPCGKRQLLTAGHMIDHAIKQFVEVDSQWKRCDVINEDQELDIALLSVDFDLPFVTPLDEKNEPEVHTNADIYGSPGGFAIVKYPGFVSATRREYQRVLDVRIRHGVSGAPVIATTTPGGEKRVIGLVVEMLADKGCSDPVDGLAIFIPCRRIRNFLSEKK